MIGNCVLSYKNAPRGCALGAGEDGCRSNRASARECARAHSFLYMGRNFLDIVMVADFVDLLEKKHRLTLFPETFIIFLRKYADGRNRSGESEDFSDR